MARLAILLKLGGARISTSLLRNPQMPSDVRVDPSESNFVRHNIAPNDANASGVSWAAIIAGAFVTAALALILLALGAGAGLSSLSPWSNSGASPAAVGFGALIWIALTEIISAASGGHLSDLPPGKRGAVTPS